MPDRNRAGRRWDVLGLKQRGRGVELESEIGLDWNDHELSIERKK